MYSVLFIKSIFIYKHIYTYTYNDILNILFIVSSTLFEITLLFIFLKRHESPWKNVQVYLNKTCTEMFIAVELFALPLSVSRQRNATKRK